MALPLSSSQTLSVFLSHLQSSQVANQHVYLEARGPESGAGVRKGEQVPMLEGPDIPRPALLCHLKALRDIDYIGTSQELGNPRRRKKIKTTLPPPPPPGVREEQEREEGEECALHWPCSGMRWQPGNVTGQQLGPLAINSPQGQRGSCLVQQSLSSLCGSTWHTVALASIMLTLPHSPTNQGGGLLSTPQLS